MLCILRLIQLSVLGCADAQLAPAEKMMQVQLMYNAVLHPKNKNTDYSLRKYFGIQNIDEGDACGWLGVQCTNGRITRFVAVRQLRYNLDIDMNWLPSSVKVIHFARFFLLDGFASALLPRDLEYLCLIECHCMAMRLKQIPPINLRQLPVGLEELHLIDSLIGNSCPLHLTALPTKLRILQIRSWRIGPSYIDWALLPRALEYIGLSTMGKKKPKVVSIGHASEPLRLEIDYGIAMFTPNSHFFYDCTDVVDEIKRRHG